MPVEGVCLRHFAGADDVAPWLALREAAFARERIGVRAWDAAEFAREFLDKPWWDPRRMWLAEASSVEAEPAAQLIGSVTLALRGSGEAARPVVHWLMVHPRWRRRGLGRLLLATLEAAAWDQGHRRLWLETHAGWQNALRLYRALGYVEED